jgi:peptidoglycan-associated lipoprotein
MEDEVNQSSRKWSFIVLALAGILTVAACHKKVAPAPPPPPPPAPQAAPTASLTASPATIELGQSSTLSWTTQDATEVTLEGIGKVGPSGSQMVTPTTSTSYRLTAKGEGGTQEATARVTVTPPSAPPETTAVPSLSDQELFARSVKDIYFDYDSYAVPAADQATLQADAAFLKSHPGMRFTIEGHCDERGSTEYNLALGENRANAAKQALVNLGVPAGSMKTISYGKEKPACTDHTEACWQQNRRAHLVLGQ